MISRTNPYTELLFRLVNEKTHSAEDLFAVKKALAEKKLDVNRKNGEGFTALMLCASRHHHELAALLMEEKKIDLEAKDNRGCTALNTACFHDNTEGALRLIENKAEINTPDMFGITPLIAAAFKGNDTVIQKLLEKKANVDAKDNFEAKATALHRATTGGYIAAVTSLLEAKADLECLNSNNQSALDIAIKTKQLELVSLLLQRNAIIRDDKLYHFLKEQKGHSGGITSFCFGVLSEQKANFERAKFHYQRSSNAGYSPAHQRLADRLALEKNAHAPVVAPSPFALVTPITAAAAASSAFTSVALPKAEPLPPPPAYDEQGQLKVTPAPSDAFISAALQKSELAPPPAYEEHKSLLAPEFKSVPPTNPHRFFPVSNNKLSWAVLIAGSFSVIAGAISMGLFGVGTPLFFMGVAMLCGGFVGLTTLGACLYLREKKLSESKDVSVSSAARIP